MALDSAAINQLQERQRALLDTVDELRALGLGTFVDFPQLIVVGDQCAGKSSVLEAISRVRFPVKDGICTRFTTELVLRKSKQTKIEVTLQGKSIDSFSHSSFSKDELPNIIEEAKQRMGIGAESTSFSEDVLRVEVSGPDVPQLTLVDLPGFYHNETDSQGVEGLPIVNRLAEKYMSQQNSIILAVISAQSELAAQIVLGEAKKHDPSRERTLGIITKPDKVEEDSTNEHQYLNLAQNKERTHKLALGWHVLRNRAQKEASIGDEERDEEEKQFFQSGVWQSIVSHNRGIDALREKLSHILLTQIQQKLPKLIYSIEEHIARRQLDLAAMGNKRSTPAELRNYLNRIGSRFQLLATQAVQGNYDDEFFGGMYQELDDTTSYTEWRTKKIRALVRDMNLAFHAVLTTKGGKFLIDFGDDENKHSNEVPRKDSSPEYLQHLIDLYKSYEPSRISIVELEKDIERKTTENQGTEFPASRNHKLILNLFRSQSSPWESIANQHVDLVVSFTKSFVEQLMTHVTHRDSRTCEQLLKDHVSLYFDEKRAALKEKVVELLQHYKAGYDPLPLNSNFRTQFGHRRIDKLADQIMVLSRLPTDNRGIERQLVVEAIGESYSHSANLNTKSTTTSSRVIEDMLVYYEISLRTFADNVVVLAMENCLMRDLPNIFTPETVSSMSDQTVKTLAEESAQVCRERKDLEAQLETLQNGLKACKPYRPREALKSLPIIPKAPNLTEHVKRNSSEANESPTSQSPNGARQTATRSDTTSSSFTTLPGKARSVSGGSVPDLTVTESRDGADSITKPTPIPSIFGSHNSTPGGSTSTGQANSSTSTLFSFPTTTSGTHNPPSIANESKSGKSTSNNNSSSSTWSWSNNSSLASTIGPSQIGNTTLNTNSKIVTGGLFGRKSATINSRSPSGDSVNLATPPATSTDGSQGPFGGTIFGNPSFGK